ncbi:peptidylprolyl isomerase [Ancylobacter terrae]|uniref:peptidylprolyl isomerase n=1 Tax=Ancylobacter sp. sgz301288 TaxID=3342077 RepID=UPI00385DF353
MLFHSPRAARIARTGFALALAGAVAFPALPAFAQGTTAATPAPAAAATTDDPVLATVNGQAIRRSDLKVAEEELGPNLPPQLVGPAREDYVLGFLIDLTALAQAAKAQKLDQTPDFAKQMEFVRQRLLMQAVLADATKAALSDEAMKKTYEEALKQQKPEEEVHARHILIRVEDAGNEKASAEAKKKIEDVIARVKKGEDFATVAKQVTEDPSGKQDGGDLGFFTKDQMVPEFANVAFAMKPGEVSEPVKTQFGWHVIKVEEKREKPLPTLDQVKPQIEQYLAQKAQAELVQNLRSAAKIEKTDAAPKTDAPAPGAPAPAAPDAAKPATP